MSTTPRSCIAAIIGLVTLAVGATAPLGDGVVAARHAIGSAGQRIDVGADARIELLSVLERLAGRPEYGVAATPYARAVDEWFAPFADDPAASCSASWCSRTASATTRR